MQTSSNKHLIYLLGAGRSGTTLLATVLNTNSKILTLGEMHQFREHLIGEKQCSCGLALKECEFWSEIIGQLPKQTAEELLFSEKKESHHNIPKILLSNKSDNEYLSIQEEIFTKISNDKPNKILLDSSKYIARYLLLSKSKKINVKGIYVVRDVRGVINSFGKKVQTPRSPLSTIIYYCLINFFGQVVCWRNNRVIKVKYEDFVSDPEHELSRIYCHVFEGKEKDMVLPEFLEMPHIIGGNRIKSEKRIVIKPDYKWRSNISRWKQICYYLFTFPFMVINKYKI